MSLFVSCFYFGSLAVLANSFVTQIGSTVIHLLVESPQTVAEPFNRIIFTMNLQRTTGKEITNRKPSPVAHFSGLAIHNKKEKHRTSQDATPIWTQKSCMFLAKNSLKVFEETGSKVVLFLFQNPVVPVIRTSSSW